jgi:hypothetical protein
MLSYFTPIVILNMTEDRFKANSKNDSLFCIKFELTCDEPSDLTVCHFEYQSSFSPSSSAPLHGLLSELFCLHSNLENGLPISVLGSSSIRQIKLSFLMLFNPVHSFDNLKA